MLKAGIGTQREWRSGVIPRQLCREQETCPRIRRNLVSRTVRDPLRNSQPRCSNRQRPVRDHL